MNDAAQLTCAKRDKAGAGTRREEARTARRSEEEEAGKTLDGTRRRKSTKKIHPTFTPTNSPDYQNGALSTASASKPQGGFEVKQVLLGHKNGSVTSHYSGPPDRSAPRGSREGGHGGRLAVDHAGGGGEAKPAKNAEIGLPERAESHPEFTQPKRKGPRMEP
ncbi:MAG: hypothetical protein MZW92_74050 [Comamonadaceae bacterium]|nr:hypothetical protein [Comamonadaceae bacterium]